MRETPRRLGSEMAGQALEAVENLIGDEDDSDYNEEMKKAPVRVPHTRVRGPAVALPLALDQGLS